MGNILITKENSAIVFAGFFLYRKCEININEAGTITDERICLKLYNYAKMLIANATRFITGIVGLR